MKMQLKKYLLHLFISIAFILPTFLIAQNEGVTIYGKTINEENLQAITYVNVTLIEAQSNQFVTGTITNEEGEFTFESILPGSYLLKFSIIGYQSLEREVLVGRLSEFIDLGNIELTPVDYDLEEIEIIGRRDDISGNLDRRVYIMDDNFLASGGSVLQAMENLAGVTIDRDGQIQLRGSDQVAVLIDGKQTAITGMGTQSGLDNIPVSSIERIEIINNPSSRYDANAMAGIVNIIYKKEEEKGWNGTVSAGFGIGSLTKKRSNISEIRDQYRYTPKVNPGFSLNYRANNINFFAQGDLLWQKKLMRNEFILREYPDGENIEQQFLENRTQPIYNIKLGLDFFPNESNSFTFFTLYNQRDYTDLGDLPYLNVNTEKQVRLWQYYEYESNKTFMASISHKYNFQEPGHFLESALNYSFRRKDEDFNFSNFLPDQLGTDTTSLTADENIFDITVDYSKPHSNGKIELGGKARTRIFPNKISFVPGKNSILDLDLQGSAEYKEWLYSIYGSYIYESQSIEFEGGLRTEYAKVDYLVDPNHSTYQSDGFDYLGLFPNFRVAYLINETNNLSIFYNRRVTRPEEKNLRVFPQYSDPEILPIGNPTLKPQFTNSFEIAYKRSYDSGYTYFSIYHRVSSQLLTKIITRAGNSNQLVLVDQNADKGYNTGFEMVWSHDLSSLIRINFNTNFYQNRIGEFSIVNAYPENTSFSQEEEKQWTGNMNLGGILKLSNDIQLQLSFQYYASDIIPQGKIKERYALDFGIKKAVQNGKGEIYLNGADLLNTMQIETERTAEDFTLSSIDYFETQILRAGYQYKF